MFNSSTDLIASCHRQIDWKYLPFLAKYQISQRRLLLQPCHCRYRLDYSQYNKHYKPSHSQFEVMVGLYSVQRVPIILYDHVSLSESYYWPRLCPAVAGWALAGCGWSILICILTEAQSSLQSTWIHTIWSNINWYQSMTKHRVPLRWTLENYPLFVNSNLSEME